MGGAGRETRDKRCHSSTICPLAAKPRKRLQTQLRCVPHTNTAHSHSPSRSLARSLAPSLSRSSFVYMYTNRFKALLLTILYVCASYMMVPLADDGGDGCGASLRADVLTCWRC